jgi:hypothetical protein
MAASQIQEVRDNKIGSVKKVAVTYLKPAIGSDVAGFFIQARKEGPALFVAVDPATTTPPLKVGDIVSFNADQTQTTQGRVEAIKISSLQLDGQGYDVSKLVQEVSKAADLVSALDAYESELIAFAIKVTGDFGAAGAGFVAAIVETAAIQGVADLRLRLPDKQGTQASLPHKMGIIKGCNLTATAIPMWRFNNTAQPSAFVESELTIQSCPDAHVVNAKASDANTVIVTFSRPIDAKSIKVDGSQFNFDNNLVASAASVSADGYEIAVTTSKQGGDTTYKVTADLSIKDNLGNAIDKVANTASFNGFVLFARLVINELNANITNGCDLVELRVISEGTVEGFEFRERTSLVLKLPRIYVKKNEYIIIHYNANSTNCNPDVATHETQSPNEKPQSQVKTNYDTAYDLYSTYSGMVATDNVLTLYDANGKIMDAVMVTKDNTKIDAAAPTRTQAVNVGNAKEWTAPDGSIPDYNDPVNFNTNAVGGLDKTSTTAASGTTIQRTSNKDTNTKDDWTSANNGTWGKNNLGQSDL